MDTALAIMADVVKHTEASGGPCGKNAEPAFTRAKQALAECDEETCASILKFIIQLSDKLIKDGKFTCRRFNCERDYQRISAYLNGKKVKAWEAPA